jgi:ADP-ribose pyrophosphatase YjhB (NUDIX family)
MTENTEPLWVHWAKELQAMAQNGLTFAQNPFDVERYTRLRELAAEIWAKGSAVESQRLLNLFVSEQGYATPKVDVRGVVFRDEAVLLVQEASDAGWTLPGGWADPNESLAESVVREIFEESGFTTKAEKLLAVYDRSKHEHHGVFPFHIYKMFVRCQLLAGEPTPSHETLQVDFFTRVELAQLPLSTSRTTLVQLLHMFDHKKNPHWPTDFD